MTAVDAAVQAEPFALFTEDGVSLRADVFRAPAPKCVAVLASAMGVKRQFYRQFAQYLASRGISVVTFNYRGIVDSDGADTASLHTWAEHDVAAAIRFAAEQVPGVPVVYVAHSVGGQIFGLAPNANQVRRAVFVGSQSGHWRMWRGLPRVGMLALWYAVIPLLVPLVGRLPMKAFRQGDDVPQGAALEWARFGRHRKYIQSYSPEAFARVAIPIRAYAIDDDGYAPPRSVAELLTFYSSAQTELKRVAPRDVGQRRIGHFGFFRSTFRESLWSEVATWLLAA